MSVLWAFAGKYL